MSETVEEQVQNILASMDEQENQEPEKETELPEQEASDALQDIYVLIVRERETEEPPEEDVISSTLVPQKTDPIDPLMYATGMFFVSLVIACIALQVFLMLNPPIATVTIIPKSQPVTLTGTLQLGRLLNPITISQSQVTPTTGKGHQEARNATGFITFYNGQLNSVTVPAGTILTSTSGIQIATDQDATIPAADLTATPPIIGQVTVTAHAVNPGSAGNIQAYSINEPCCTSVVAKNTQNFTGGQNARDFQTVTQADIDGVAATLKTTLAQSMQGALTGQLKSGEALISPNCTPTTTADHRPGEEAVQVKVIASETCSAVAYDTQSLNTRVTQLLAAQATKKLGAGYSELGSVTVQVTKASAQNKTILLSIVSQGVWVYALDKLSQEHIKHLIAGKTKQDALHILQSLPGIEQVSTQWDEHTKLPKDIRYIHLVILAGIYRG